MSTKTIFCFLLGTKNIFSVDYNEKTTVDHLKEAIRQKNLDILANIWARDLTLYKINVDISDDNEYPGIIDEISRGTFAFNPPKQPLNPSRLVSRIFQKDSKETIDVLVELPEG